MALGPLRQPPHLAVRVRTDEVSLSLTNQNIHEYQTINANNNTATLSDGGAVGPSSHVMFTQRVATTPKLALVGCPAPSRKLPSLVAATGVVKSCDRSRAAEPSTRPPRNPLSRSVALPANDQQGFNSKRIETSASCSPAGGSHIMKIACREVPSRGYERFSDTPIVAAVVEESRQLPMLHRHNTSPLLSRINTPSICGLPTFAPAKRGSQFDDGVTLKRVTSSPMMGVAILACADNNFLTDCDGADAAAISASFEPGQLPTEVLATSGQCATIVRPKATRRDGVPVTCLPRSVSPVRRVVSPVVHDMCEAVSLLLPQPTVSRGVVLCPPALSTKNGRCQLGESHGDKIDAHCSLPPVPCPSSGSRSPIWEESAFCRRPKSLSRLSHDFPAPGARAKENKREGQGIVENCPLRATTLATSVPTKDQQLPSPTGLGGNFKSAERLIEWAEHSAWRQLRIAQKSHH